eukprot:jgi/Mesen1/7384/ME000382S06580
MTHILRGANLCFRTQNLEFGLGRNDGRNNLPKSLACPSHGRASVAQKLCRLEAYWPEWKNWWSKPLGHVGRLQPLQTLQAFGSGLSVSAAEKTQQASELEPAIQVETEVRDGEGGLSLKWSLQGVAALSAAALLIVYQGASPSSSDTTFGGSLDPYGTMRAAIEAVESGQKQRLVGLLAEDAVFTYQGTSARSRGFSGRDAALKGIDKYDVLFDNNVDNLKLYIDVSSGALVATYESPSMATSREATAEATPTKGPSDQCRVEITFDDAGFIQGMNESCHAMVERERDREYVLA